METYSLSPVNRNVGTVDVGRRAVFQIFETRVAGLLGEAGLVT